MRGKTPTPTTLKIMRGNPGRRPLNRDEPSSPLLKRMPPAPGFLDDEGKRAWSLEGRRLIKAGLLTALDLTMFGTWCIWYSKRDIASRAVNKSGLVIKAGGVGNPYINPYMSVISMCSKAMHQIEIEFGLSPASRTKVKSLNPAQRSLFDALLDDEEEAGS
ncbi:phage terminase small subunit P27 family [Candidatus Binatus sp.]|uniref:phage terminase small subunit P27 family n=1 Tax=Candidatus Binatus sp. TaxID=2811406 RepID=UPI002F9538D8